MLTVPAHRVRFLQVAVPRLSSKWPPGWAPPPHSRPPCFFFFHTSTDHPVYYCWSIFKRKKKSTFLICQMILLKDLQWYTVYRKTKPKKNLRVIFKVLIHLALTLTSNQPSLVTVPWMHFPQVLTWLTLSHHSGLSWYIAHLRYFPYDLMKNSTSCPTLPVLSSFIFFFLHLSLPTWSIIYLFISLLSISHH